MGLDAEEWTPTVLRPPETIPRKTRAMAIAAVFLRRSEAFRKLAAGSPKTVPSRPETPRAAKERTSCGSHQSTPAVPPW